MPFKQSLDELSFRYIQTNPDRIVLDTELVWIHPDTGDVYKCPVWTKADGQSVPPWAWPFVGHPLEGQSIRAAIFHDYHYQTGLVDRATADRIFLIMCLEDGVPAQEAYLKYMALRAFGWWAWRNHRKNDKMFKQRGE